MLRWIAQRMTENAEDHGEVNTRRAHFLIDLWDAMARPCTNALQTIRTTPTA